MNVTLYEKATLREGADIAIRAKLFIQGWSLYPTLCDLRERRYPGTSKIAIGYKDGIPICLALIDPHEMFMAFCRKSERRNGYTSRCIKALGSNPTGWASEGVHGTLDFWKANGVYAIPRR